MGFRVQGSGLRVQGLGLRVEQKQRARVENHKFTLTFQASRVGFTVQGFQFGVWGIGFWV